MNSKQRAYLRKISAMEAPIFQVGKSSVTPELTAAIDEALEKRELIKLSVLKNCFDDPSSSNSSRIPLFFIKFWKNIKPFSESILV